jgi:hypothetical protein
MSTPSIPSKEAKEAKSVSLSGGAGADGDMGALSGILMGGRVEVAGDRRILVGAVAPPLKSGVFRPWPL